MRILLYAITVMIIACSKNPFSKDKSVSETDLAFRDANIPVDAEQGVGLFRNIYFEFDSAELSPQALNDLQYNLNVLKSDPSLRVTLEGHCDIRGTKDYNYALGSRRANSVKNWLLKNGISEDRLKTVSYGADMPLSLGTSEEDHAMNRRVHFRY
ncbi:MAG: OmpA family protein [Deltaproteobacteria bacterium]|nr:OmpA family protein [Deltaproteobacteria bacterium]MCX7952767.1 OmpA family protein [Deltaproteobacteria bacterium]